MAKEKKRDFLISCNFEEYCQGWEETYGWFLVRAETYEQACFKLRTALGEGTTDTRNVHNFRNCTVE